MLLFPADEQIITSGFEFQSYAEIMDKAYGEQNKLDQLAMDVEQLRAELRAEVAKGKRKKPPTVRKVKRKKK